MATAKKQESAAQFKKTFKTYDSMTDSEKAAFRQGATTVSNRVQEQIGLRKPKDE
jgi:hypothetical protein